MRKLLIIAVVAFLAIAPGVVTASETSDFAAILTGAEEVGPVQTTATGEAEFELDESGNALHFRIEVQDITDVFMGHIHQGPRGVNGPIVVWLFPRTPSTTGPRLSGNVEFSGTVTAADFVGPLRGKTIADLAALLRSGNAYANVHTNAHPGGEARGQIFSDD